MAANKFVQLHCNWRAVQCDSVLGGRAKQQLFSITGEIPVVMRLGWLPFLWTWVLSGLLAIATGPLVQRSTMAAEAATGVMLYQQVDASTFRYTIDLQNSGTTNIGTFWYSWIASPAEDFMGVMPTNVLAPTGWAPTITHAGVSDGFAIQFVDSGSIAPGTIVRGFSFNSSETPAQMAGKSPDFPATPIGTSFIYSGAPFSDAGTQFNIVPTAFPWQNPFTPLDVDGNGKIQPQDVHLLINDLLVHGTHSLATPTASNGPAPFLDVVGDNVVQPNDVNSIITFLLSNPSQAPVPMESTRAPVGSASMVSATIQSVPEPTSETLAIVAAGLLGLIGLHQRRRQGSKRLGVS